MAYWFPIAAVTDCHKYSGFKHHGFSHISVHQKTAKVFLGWNKVSATLWSSLNL